MKLFYPFLFSIALVFGLVGCVDNTFDEPTGTIKIDESKVVPISTVLGAMGKKGITYADDHYIKATVTADDASGNFYKQLVMQDETGAISVAADQNELNAAYPRGSSIYVKLKGLYIGKNNNLPQIGLGSTGGRPSRIPDALVAEYLIKGSKAGAVIQPKEVTIKEILSGKVNVLNILITIKDVEFADQYIGATYATPETTTGQRAENRRIEDCNDNSIIARNSDFANFATAKLPTGNGSITAIASIYRKDYQLFVRDTSDVAMTGDRCDGSGGQVGNEITIGSIKKKFYDLGADKVDEGYITGIVISDKDANITNNRNLFIQNGKEGILLRFGAPHSFELGEKIQVTVSGAQLSEFNEVLQINNVALLNAKSLGKGNVLQPRVATIAEIKADFNNFESTLVTIKNGKLPAGKKFSDRFDLEDPTGKLLLYTSSKATFAKESVPSGDVEVTGIIIEFKGTQEIIVNGPSYIKSSTGGGDPGGGGDDNSEIAISKVREAYKGSKTKAPKGYITGTVISDRKTGQVNGRNVIIQNGDAGILVRFKKNHSFDLSDQVKVTVSGIELSEYKGVLQVNGVALDAANNTGVGNLPAPKEVTVAAYTADEDKYESTRILVMGAELSSDDGTYTGTVSVKDATGTVGMYINNRANFKGESLPTGKLNVLAIGTSFNKAQLLLNSKDDVRP